MENYVEEKIKRTILYFLFIYNSPPLLVPQKIHEIKKFLNEVIQSLSMVSNDL